MDNAREREARDATAELLRAAMKILLVDYGKPAAERDPLPNMLAAIAALASTRRSQ